jgi:ATP-dependent Clp endopeptidase proteolytic subunit ClpP
MKIEALYKVTNNVSSARLEIFGEIGEYGFRLKDFTAAVGSMDVSTLEIDLNSPGGDPLEAFAIHDAIKALKARVTVNIIGVAASAATIIAAAADRVTITENSRYLVHESSSIMAGKKADMLDTADTLSKIDKQMLSVYVKRTGKPEAELDALMKKDTFLSAEEALSWGFVDEIIRSKTIKMTAMTEKTKPVALTEEEKEEMDALKAELSALKAKLAEYEKEEKAKKAKAENDEEVDARINAAVEKAIKAAIDAAAVKAPILASVPAPVKEPEPDMPPKDAFFAKLKAGQFKSEAEMAEEYKKVFKN